MELDMQLVEAINLMDQGKLEQNIEKIMDKLKEDEEIVNQLISIIRGQSVNKVDLFNAIAVSCYQHQLYDFIIPLLEEALKENEFHKDTLVNLGQFLSELGEYKLALSHVNQIKEKDQEVESFIEYLNGFKAEENILDLEQNDVVFTGERLVINQTVKNQYSNVLEEHIHRYEMATKYAKDRIVLDAACGAGYGSKMMIDSGASFVYGVDISEESLMTARRDYGAPNLEFTYGDVNQLPFKDASFDMIISFETIEHIENGANWIRESARLLKEDGLFLVSTPNRAITNPGTYFVERPFNPHHRYEYTTTEFVGELLKEYDVLELYGQTFTNDDETHYTAIMRQLRKLNTEIKPNQHKMLSGDKHELIPLGEVKDMQPMYVVAVCRKKRNNIRQPLVDNSATHAEIRKQPKSNQSFYKFGTNSIIGTGCEIVGPEAISIGNNVFIKKDCWLNIALNNFEGEPRIIIDDGCQIGKNLTISVANKVVLEKNVLIGPNVYIADCGHQFNDIEQPIMHQGVTSTTNEVHIGEGSWLGINSVIVGNVKVGRGCVIAANTFVNKDIPDYSVVAGNPGKIIKMYDSVSNGWVRVNNDEEIQKIMNNRIL